MGSNKIVILTNNYSSSFGFGHVGCEGIIMEKINGDWYNVKFTKHSLTCEATHQKTNTFENKYIAPAKLGRLLYD